jgi:hypothetical protein
VEFSILGISRTTALDFSSNKNGKRRILNLNFAYNFKVTAVC